MVGRYVLHGCACAVLLTGFSFGPATFAGETENPLAVPKGGVQPGKDRRENLRDWRDRKENVRDRREDARDKREDVRDQRDDHRKRERMKTLTRRVRHLKQTGGDPSVIAKLEAQRKRLRKNIRRDKREDVRDRREDVRDRREDVRDRREDVRDRREGVRDRRNDGSHRKRAKRAARTR